MNFKKSLIIALLSLGIVNASVAERPDEMMSRAEQYYAVGNYKKAFPIIQQLAKDGFTDAQFYTATLYHRGKGVKQDIKKAVYWYEKASEAGQPMAQLTMGLLYFEGRVFKKDLHKARIYVVEACRNEMQEACSFLEQIPE